MESILGNRNPHTLAAAKLWSGPVTAEASLEVPQKLKQETTMWFSFMNYVYTPEGL